MTLQMTNNSNSLQAINIDPVVIEKLVVDGDISKLKPEERLSYYYGLCKSLGLNPVTRPFEYMQLKGKLTLYAKKDATEQLRKINGVSVIKLEREVLDTGLYMVTAHVETKDGRSDISTGVINTAALKGDELANAFMKAETKAKRRATLSICGLGIVDESEIESVRGAVRIKEIDGELIEESSNTKAALLENKTEPQQFMELSLEEVLQDIRSAETEDELRDVFNMVNKSKLKKNEDCREAIRQEKENWYINRGM